jgi:mannose-6-phosphate isomerase-like protein (cupin superfamily)
MSGLSASAFGFSLRKKGQRKMRKIRLWQMVGAVAVTALVFAADAPRSAAVNYVDRDEVNKYFDKAGTFITGPDFEVQGNHRVKAGVAELHVKETDVLYIIDGEGTIVTGGKMIGSNETAPNQLRGTGIEGGETHHLKKGDVITIRAGVPHWFKETGGIQYFVVKVKKP